MCSGPESKSGRAAFEAWHLTRLGHVRPASQTGSAGSFRETFQTAAIGASETARNLATRDWTKASRVTKTCGRTGGKVDDGVPAVCRWAYRSSWGGGAMCGGPPNVPCWTAIRVDGLVACCISAHDGARAGWWVVEDRRRSGLLSRASVCRLLGDGGSVGGDIPTSSLPHRWSWGGTEGWWASSESPLEDALAAVGRRVAGALESASK